MIPFKTLDQVIDKMKECLPKGDKFQIEESCIIGGHQHYVGDIYRLTLKYEEDKIQKKKSLVLKVPKSNDSAATFSKLEMIVREPPSFTR